MIVIENYRRTTFLFNTHTVSKIVYDDFPTSLFVIQMQGDDFTVVKKIKCVSNRLGNYRCGKIKQAFEKKEVSPFTLRTRTCITRNFPLKKSRSRFIL